ncbi:hypothetical protein [Bosea vaviloviae]|uniref:Uncharacterized protein n=1 Tax=Bosea vaviloviae TaxID=1526658 RepID=A0A1D7TYW0_9HYPH|nr:hypothetical protein [Bosea vaviloviae]AOO80308.1 hypothetical protein BHK69_07360 [Bosea vaviloviae]
MPRSPLILHSEAYSASGNLAADGYLKLLGAPSIDLVQTVVREAVQNSCDAAISDGGAEVHFRLRTLDRDQAAVLRHDILGQRPLDHAAAQALEAYLSSARPRVLEICDFGTTGLAGPTRADLAVNEDEPSDFVDFLRNVGSPRNTTHSGGTYGYGKASLYMASRCSAILIDSQTFHAGQPTRRVIAAQLGLSFAAEDTEGVRRRFTGRHWWGAGAKGDEFVDPLEGPEAATLAEDIGFPVRDPSRSGTSIMILDPLFVDQDEVRALRLIEESLLFFFWPRMLECTPRSRRMHFRIFVENVEYPLPRPEDFPPLDLFARAMSGLRSSPTAGEEVRSQRPNRVLGRLNIVRGLRAERRAPAGLEGSLFPERSAAIAVMRPVELVVRYYPGNQLPDDRFEWGGVFVASNDETVEAAFARAEPPAHDDWQHEALADRVERSIVRIAVNRIKIAAAEYATPVSAARPGGETGPSFAKVAGLLGRVLEGDGEGAGARASGGGGGGGGGSRSALGVSRPVFARLEQGASGPVAVFQLEIKARVGGQTVLLLEPALVMDGGIAADVSSIARPTVLAVRDEAGDLFRETARVEIGGRAGRFEVSVVMPSDCAVTLGARLVSGADNA